MKNIKLNFLFRNSFKNEKKLNSFDFFINCHGKSIGINKRKWFEQISICSIEFTLKLYPMQPKCV